MPTKVPTHVLLIVLGLGCVSCASKGEPVQAPPRPRLEFIGEWGTEGEEPGQLSHPVSLAVDTVGNVYVADAGSRFVHKFSPEGRPLASFQDPALVSPDGIAVDQGGAIYVADPTRGTVVIFFPNGERLRVFKVGPRRASEEPMGVDVSSDGEIFVVDSGRHALLKFNPRGRLLKSWIARGKDVSPFNRPADVAVAADGSAYVSDTGHERAVRISPQGDTDREYLLPAALAKPIALAGLAVTARHLFAADPIQHRICVWALDGSYVHTESLVGLLQTKQPSPYALSLTPRGELLVLDSQQPRVLRFRLNF